jgi:predicted PurR-regulated permease PerM
MDLVMFSTILLAVVVFIAAAVIAVIFTRNLVRQVNGVTDSLKHTTIDEMGTLKGMAASIQPATATIVKNNVSVKRLIDSYEEGLSGLQDVADDIREIVHSIDDVLEEFEGIDSKPA